MLPENHKPRRSAVKVPRKVTQYLAKEHEQWSDADELLAFLQRNRMANTGNPAMIAYALGCDYATAKSAANWMQKCERADN